MKIAYKKGAHEKSVKRDDYEYQYKYNKTTSCCVISATAAMFNILAHLDMKAKYGEEGQKFLRSMAEVPAIMNNSLNFVFYVFSGHTFRDTFKQKYFRRFC